MKIILIKIIWEGGRACAPLGPLLATPLGKTQVHEILSLNIEFEITENILN